MRNEANEMKPLPEIPDWLFGMLVMLLAVAAPAAFILVDMRR